MAWLRGRTSVPLFADEAVLSVDQLDAVAELHDGVVVKVSKTGGMAGACALVSACTGRGLRVLLGCMVESSLGIVAGLQLAGLADHVDLDGALLLTEDPFTGIARGACGPGATRRSGLPERFVERRARARHRLEAAGAVGHDRHDHLAVALAGQRAVVRVAVRRRVVAALV